MSGRKRGPYPCALPHRYAQQDPACVVHETATHRKVRPAMRTITAVPQGSWSDRISNARRAERESAGSPGVATGRGRACQTRVLTQPTAARLTTTTDVPRETSSMSTNSHDGQDVLQGQGGGGTCRATRAAHPVHCWQCTPSQDLQTSPPHQPCRLDRCVGLPHQGEGGGRGGWDGGGQVSGACRSAWSASG